MIRNRSGPPAENNDEGSSSDDDVFSALSRKRKGLSSSLTSGSGQPAKKSTSSNIKELPVPVVGAGSANEPSLSKTSSIKRHHGELSDTRKAKMDALILELEAGTARAASEPKARDQRRGAPERSRGSFVDPGDELLTTNIFVGNLAPSITEEHMSDLFRQFGDLYSVKIMWPRTPEERARNRHTGFVCYMNRQDAEDAMDACSEADPFRVGRQLMMRWGKNVRKVAGGTPIVKKGTGGIVHTNRVQTDAKNYKAAAVLEESLGADSGQIIRVVNPVDEQRSHLISTVASFVAKDGEQLEQLLQQRELGNPDFHFLSFAPNATEQQKQECVFYRWRVYSLCQGDTFHTWRIEPFKMIVNGCRWIPPPRDDNAVRKEAEAAKRQKEELASQKEKRKFQSSKRGLLTGRQLEQARRRGGDTGVTLSELDLVEFDKLFKESLFVSRASICKAMSFCFEKSGAAKQLSAMLKDLLIQIAPGTSVEILTARVFLLSDVLYNSQQPGVRNAFLYRDAIEQMSPEVFKGLGEYTRANFGRMTSSKLEVAVNAVFAAWVNWGVFDPVFLDELQALFEGREHVSGKIAEDVAALEASAVDDKRTSIATDSFAGSNLDPGPVQLERSESEARNTSDNGEILHRAEVLFESVPDDNDDGDPLDDSYAPEADDSNGGTLNDDPDGESVDDDLDGEPLDDDPDGDPLDDDLVESFVGNERTTISADNCDVSNLDTAPEAYTPDGEPLDGEPLYDDPDGEPLHINMDGEPLPGPNDAGR